MLHHNHFVWYNHTMNKVKEVEPTHPCVECGKPCNHRVPRCRQCSYRFRWKILGLPPPNERINKCIDCEKQIGWRNDAQMPKRCTKCNLKFIRTLYNTGTQLGAKNWRWKGGRVQSPTGYVNIYAPNHPRAVGKRSGHRYVGEHIIIWEKHTGKFLPDGWLVHHLNGIKNDNRVSNLVALPNQKHYLVLAAKAKRIQELEALLQNQGQLI